jgi:RNA polymerase sigma factor (sigma-70 family)
MTPPTAPLPDDASLLRCYVREGSELAFRQLMARHLPLVWSVARRALHGDSALAEDVAQTVLVDFAAMAHRLPPEMPPSGWLHRHTVFTASKVVRSESRRRAREQESLHGEAPPADTMNSHSDKWVELAPHLDAALDRLKTEDREALILRYYDGMTLRAVGVRLGLSEEATRKRIDRALAKLSTLLKRRGLVTAAVLSIVLRENAVSAPSPDAACRILAEAWEKVTTHAVSSAASHSLRPAWPWLRRGAVVGGVLAIFGIGWIYFAGPDGPPAARRLRSDITPRESSASPAPSLPVVRVTATIMTLPEEGLGRRMLTYDSRSGDDALYQELLPRAQELQKAVKPEETWATTGHPLVVLSGDVVPGRVVALAQEKSFTYDFDFSFDDTTGFLKPIANTAKTLGTRLQVQLHHEIETDAFSIEMVCSHAYADPEETAWPYREPVSDHPRAGTVSQPGFFFLKWASMGDPNFFAGHNKVERRNPPKKDTDPPSMPLPIPNNCQVLAGMQSIAPEFLPISDPAARRAFLFLKIEP